MKGDNLNEFKKVYIENIKAISLKTKKLRKINDSNSCFIDSTICWMSNSNLENILGLILFSKRILFDKENIKKLLLQNRMLSFYQDSIDNEGNKEGNDHYFIVIGNGEKNLAYIIEYLSDIPYSFYTNTIDNIVRYLSNIKNGKTIDRFYYQQRKHRFEIDVYVRKELSKESILDYLK